ncbi:MAG: hypothetical protein ACRD43_13735, partial [Pyrinomonadaceae bacterium]
NRSVRLDVVPGVPLKNPLYDKKCSIGAACEPYVNPAAFMRPVKGELGNSGRTISLRSPLQQYFDASIQKTWNMPFIGREGNRRINFRVDLLNAFNTPTFRFNNTGNTPFGFGTFPTEFSADTEPNPSGGTRAAAISATEYNAWAIFNGQPLSTTPAGLAQLNAIRANVDNVRLTTNALPTNFYHVPVPTGFATTNPLAFDIRTLSGYKLYRIRQTYDANFGTLFANPNPRYIQFGIRLFF